MGGGELRYRFNNLVGNIAVEANNKLVIIYNINALVRIAFLFLLLHDSLTK